MGWFGFGGGGGGGGSSGEDDKRRKRRVRKKPDTPASKKAAASVLSLGPEGQDPYDPALWSVVPQRPRDKVKLDFEERQQVDYVRMIFRKNVWYYRDRMSVPRGPCNLPVLREAWVNGIIDENTLVWGQGLIDWLPVKNVRTLIPMVRTVEVRMATWLKRQLSLKPALRAIRRHRGQERKRFSTQVDDMY